MERVNRRLRFTLVSGRAGTKSSQLGTVDDGAGSTGSIGHSVSVLAGWLLPLLFLTVLNGCGAGGYVGGGIASLSASSLTIDAGQSITVIATASQGTPVTWSITGSGCSGASCGSLSTTAGSSTTYKAPATVGGPMKLMLQAAINGTHSNKIVAITVNPAPQISSPPSAGTVGVAYNTTFSVTGGTTPVKLSLLSGSLPSGLTLDATTGIVTGTPMTAGTFSVILQATDTSDVPDTVSATEMFVIADNTTGGGTGTGPGTGTGTSILTVASNTLPVGTVGISYLTTLQATGGTAPYSWSVTSGSLPAGLTLKASNGVISGIPTSEGTTTFTAQVQDSSGATATGNFSITVSPAAAPVTLALNTGTLPNGTVNVAYSSTIGVTGGTAPYACTVAAGTLPAGLILGADCLVSGTPTAAGTANLTIAATDSANPANSGSGPVTLVINPAAVLTLSSPPAATAGSPSTGSVGVSGGTGPYTCVLAAGTLPAGLTLNSNCSLSGTPTSAGSAPVTVQATDSSSPSNSTTGSVTISVNPAPTAGTLIIGTLPSGTVGTAYSANVGVNGGTGPYTCSITSGMLPAGLLLGNNCLVSGTPTIAGTTNLTVRATDTANPALSTTGDVSLLIHPFTALTLSSPPAATVGAPYTGAIGVAGGTGPYNCNLMAGNLPAGLALGAHCAITGTPSSAGSATITVQATDSSSPVNTTTGPVNVTVNAVPATLTVGTPPAATVNTPYTGTIPVAGGTAPYQCTITSGSLPAGIELGAGCALSGTPTTTGTATVNITATDAANPVDTKTAPVTVTVNGLAPLTLNGSLPNAVVGTPYTQTLSASGGLTPYTYAVTSGALPAGLTLASNGTLSGTPTAPGASSFTVTATDSEGTPQTASLPLVLLVTYPTTAADTELVGPYAFLFQGFDGAVAGVLSYGTASVGSFTADGTGVISAGELDENHQGSTATANFLGSHRFVGTYTIGTDGRGFLTITRLNQDGTTGRTSTYAVALKAPVAPATVGTQGSLIEYDGSGLVGTRGTGTLLAQDPAAITAGLNGNYAFGLEGDTPCLVSCGLNLNLFGPVAEVGQLTVHAGAVTGTADATIAAASYASEDLAGSVAAADANGRVPLTLATAGVPTAVYPTDYAVYIVNANQAFVMSTDKHSAFILLAGNAQLQTQATFSNASANGPYVGYENAPTNPGLVGQTLQNVLNLTTATVFQGNGDGAGNCNTNSVTQAGTTALVNALTGLGGLLSPLQGVLGTYTVTGTSACPVAANGREVLNYVAPHTNLGGIIVVTGTAPAPRVAYLYGPNQGFFLETGYAGLGHLEAQTGEPFSLASFQGTYVFGGTAPAAVVSTSNSGVLTANGQGSATATLDGNLDVGSLNVLQLGVAGTFPYTLTSGTFGTYTLGTADVIYAISPNRYVLVDTSATTTSPSVALLY